MEKAPIGEDLKARRVLRVEGCAEALLEYVMSKRLFAKYLRGNAISSSAKVKT